jgi:PAT family beta-lactamase induction signal transducer AmpG
MLDPAEMSGLGLDTEQVGFLYGTVGVIALLLGGILGGVAISRKGLKYWILPMAAAISLPDFVYVYFAWLHPDSFLIINICVFIEQFGYGFGFAAFTMFLVYISDGKFKTAHYAFCTGLMALGMMFPSMIAGKLQEFLGYRYFFIWVMLCTTLTFVAVFLVKIDKDFGKKPHHKGHNGFTKDTKKM